MPEIHGSRWHTGVLPRVRGAGRPTTSCADRSAPPADVVVQHNLSPTECGQVSSPPAAGDPQPPGCRETRPTPAGGDQRDRSVGAHPVTRYTEADGWRAVWRREYGRIRILEVRRVYGSSKATVTDSLTLTSDLADLREEFPEHSRLWDAVRHEFWVNVVPDGLTG